jgi:DNA-directed RNA polymerase subunit RPC12/RpoP
MTDREKAIVMAYTGVCMLNDDKFKIFHEYVEEIMGRPVYTHELADKKITDEIKEKAKDDFIALCGRMTTEEEIETLKNHKPYDLLNAYKVGEALDMAIKALEQEPCEKGKWLNKDASGYRFYGKCSECGQEFCLNAWYAQNMKYCPNCGCRMIGVQESEDKE